MPTFVPTPSNAQWFYWIRPGGQRPIISKWPKAGSNRTDCRFNLPISEGNVWSASRWWHEISLSGPVPDYLSRGYLDLEAIGVNHLFGESGVNDEDWNVELDVIGYNSTPVVGEVGVVCTLRASNLVLGAEMQWMLWYLNEHAFPWELNIDLLQETADFGQFTTFGLPFGTFTGLQGGSLPDCMPFDPMPGPVEGFCACNGVDAYILFDSFFPNVSTRFKMEFDFRPTGPDEQMVAFGYTGFGSFAYMFVGFDKFQWWNKVLNLPDGLNPGVWNHVRIEYDWSIPGAAYSIWLDDVLQETSGGGFITWIWDEIGRRGTTIEGKFDLNHVKMWDGSPASPNLLVDVPLTADACAVEPSTIKGTTFNMDLASCP